MVDGKIVGLFMEFENYFEVGIDLCKDSLLVIDVIVWDFLDFEIYVVGSLVVDYVMDDLIV